MGQAARGGGPGLTQRQHEAVLGDGAPGSSIPLAAPQSDRTAAPPSAPSSLTLIQREVSKQTEKTPAGASRCPWSDPAPPLCASVSSSGTSRQTLPMPSRAGCREGRRGAPGLRSLTGQLGPKSRSWAGRPGGRPWALSQQQSPACPGWWGGRVTQHGPVQEPQELQRLCGPIVWMRKLRLRKP